MRAVYLHDLSPVLGQQRLSLEDSAAAGRLRSRPQALRDAGFACHRLALPSESAMDLAHSALSPLAASHRDAGALVLACTLTPQLVREPTREVTQHLGLGGARLLAGLQLQRAFVAGVTEQACTSALGALRVARGLLAAEPDLSPILACAADRLPEGVTLEQGFSPLSDGAAACVVSTQARGYRLVAFHAVVHGALAGADDDQAMGRLFPVANALVRDVLARAGKAPRDLARLVPPNFPVAAARILARSLEIPEELASSPTLADAGHVMSCDPLLSLAEIERRGELRSGDLVLLLAAGYGLTWQAALLERMPS